MSGQNFLKFYKGETILCHKRLAGTNGILQMVSKMLTSMITKWQCSPRNKMMAIGHRAPPAGSTRSQEVSPGPKQIHQVRTGCRFHQVPAGLKLLHLTPACPWRGQSTAWRGRQKPAESRHCNAIRDVSNNKNGKRNNSRQSPPLFSFIKEENLAGIMH